MKTMQAFYSLIQYCPDFSRYEMVNVGLVLWVPENHFIATRVRRDNNRVRRFFGQESFNPHRLNFAKSSLERRLQVEKGRLTTIDDFKKFVDSRGNELVLTDPRPVKVTDPEKELNQLFSDLVGARGDRKRTRPVFPKLDKAFHSPRFANRAIDFHTRVTVPIVNRRLEIPYAYHNGTYNLIKPQLFPGRPTEATEVGMRLAVEGHLIQTKPEENERRRLIVLPRVEGVQRPLKLRQSLTELLGEYEIRTIWEEQLGRFENEVYKQAPIRNE